MNKEQIEFRDPVVERVVDKFVSRSDVGFAKYGVTLNDDKSNLFAWINHLQEELMDAVLYMQKLKESSTEEMQEALLRNIEIHEETTL
jgi:hypothetical protein